MGLAPLGKPKPLASEFGPRVPDRGEPAPLEPLTMSVFRPVQQRMARRRSSGSVGAGWALSEANTPVER